MAFVGFSFGRLIMLKPNQVTKCGFEQREIVGDGYLKDPRWKEVQRLREPGPDQDVPRSNGLVTEIHITWGVD